MLELGTAMHDPAGEVMLGMAVAAVFHTRHSSEPLYMFSQIPPASSLAPLHTVYPIQNALGTGVWVRMGTQDIMETVNLMWWCLVVPTHRR